MAQKGRVGTITATAPPAEKEFQGSGIEGTKGTAAESPEEPTVITCDAVLKNLRAQGHDV